ncbi:hypothetical protein [Pseudanabaena sp. FACHB-2040]|uniref:hypothetical protein n=1 Tax=Pseudanabaena sp. FACHB-2040 TaxID=2692859 RepID=UPI001688765C|nr:hypothetical protein [Pseudanabaena sp. FACHB-2040]MBD0269695.1 hypothetical protein [Cyanobacteria bacterium Co-bin8]MBD2260128.1 hypothetical protein [Pseudanabaena sp. FACHB-2040]
MNPLQEQVVVLTDKVDALHQMIDQINAQVSEILAGAKPHSFDGSDSLAKGHYLSSGRSPVHGLRGPAFEHKDILLDTTYMDLDRRSSEPELSSEVQIQRLTAQLTAAYNRIAALEEQLLACRAQ